MEKRGLGMGVAAACVIAGLCLGALATREVMQRGFAKAMAEAEKQKAQTAQAQMPRVVVGPVTTIKESGMKKYVGAVQAIEDVTLYARVSGFLEKINFREGEMVKKGDLLFKIEDDTYAAKFKAAEAKLKQVDAELKFAESNYRRQTDLAKNKVIATKELEDAERKINFVRAQHAEAQFNLTEAKTNLSYANIAAPVSGRIGKSAFTIGNYLTLSSGALATIVQTAPIYVSFAISEQDMVALFKNAEGMKKNAVIRVRTAERNVYGETGRVTLVDNRVESGTGTVKVWATFDNKDNGLLPGALVDVIITKAEETEVPAVPATAVVTTGEGHVVYVVGPGNVVIPRPVKLGELVGNTQGIAMGLRPGEPVIVDGVHKVRPGAPIVPCAADGTPLSALLAPAAPAKPAPAAAQPAAPAAPVPGKK